MVYVATNESRKIIREANDAEKAGEVVDWDEVMRKVDEASAKGKDQQIKAIALKGKRS